jgi:hypothetical protein
MLGKQEKVVKSITRDNKQTSSHLQMMKKNPNDECYTSMVDILAELSYWASLGKFVGKRIVCPCDWDIVEGEGIYSITIDFEEDSIHGNSVRRVGAISYSLFDECDGGYETVSLSKGEFDGFLKNRLTCNFIRTFVQMAADWGIKSITASGYDPSTDRGIRFQDVDYSKYDICVTNPPFSLYKEFMSAIVGRIDFIVLAPFAHRVGTIVGLPLMLKQAYLGHKIQTHMNFVNPTRDNGYKSKVVCCDWVTSFPDAQEERNGQSYHSGISYELYKDEYEFMENMTMRDGTHPMIVGAGTIPDDYDGWMFAPVSVLDKLNTDEYDMYCTALYAYFNKVNPEANPFAHNITDEMLKHNGKSKFHGWVIRKKKSA